MTLVEYLVCGVNGCGGGDGVEESSARLGDV